MTVLGWGSLVRLCLVNAAIGAMAALPVNLFNRLMTVELALPALLPGLLVALHYAVQLSRPAWGHRSDRGGQRTPFILGGMAALGLAVSLAAWTVGVAESSVVSALILWVIAYTIIGFGVGAAGTSFLALLAAAAPERRRGAAATLAWLMLIAGAIASSVGVGSALEPYSPDRLTTVVAVASLLALVVTWIGVFGIERRLGPLPAPSETRLAAALRAAWADPRARSFTGFVFLSILAFYLSELVFEPFAGHVHGLAPDQSTKLSGGKDGAALMGMIAAGLLSTLRIGSLRFWAIAGCGISAAGLLALGTGLPLVPATVTLGVGNGLFVVGAVGSMMRLAAEETGATGTRMGVFGAAQAIAAGLAGLVATGTLDALRWGLEDASAYGVLFATEAALFILAALVALSVLRTPAPAAVPGE